MSDPGPQAELVLEMRGITKTFPGVLALDAMDFDIRAGEVHAIVGENGAGKSTLMKILAGAYQRDAGDILLKGVPVNIHDPSDAIGNGIGIVYQDLQLVPTLTVLANIYLGREPSTFAGKLDNRTLRTRYEKLCSDVGLYLDPDVKVLDLSLAERQLVEILKILDREVDLIVLDEPTAALDQRSKGTLYQAVRRLRSQGVSFILITHFIEEVFGIADRVTILRDGRHVATLTTVATSHSEVVRLMIGQSQPDMFPEQTDHALGPAVLEVRDLSLEGAYSQVALTLHEGEIVGLTGLVGSGGSELAHTLVGDLTPDSGAIRVDGDPMKLASPAAALQAGICLLPGDRKTLGLHLDLEVFKNVSLSSLEQFSKWNVISPTAEQANAVQYVDQLRIATPSTFQRVRNLSGGNQQKVVLARMLSTDARVLILDEPTQGIDVHAKEEIFALIRRLADQGKSILFISSEFKEIAGVADWAVVLKDGAVVASLGWQDVTEAGLIEAATAGPQDAAK